MGKIAGYVPDGLSAAEWEKMRARESAEKKKKNFAAFGPQSFKSRSLQSFQKEMEQGKASHLMPVFNAKQKIREGKIKDEDVPYMQRGGSWDNSDLKTAKKVKWNEDDKKYQQNGGQRNFLDWSGTGSRSGPSTRSAPANKKNQAQQQPKTQKLFGLF